MNRLVLLTIGVVALAGCQSASRSPATQTAAQQPPKALSVAAHPAQYWLSGDIANPGSRVLSGGETVVSALREILPTLPKQQTLTVVLVRRGPEGTTRELIDFDSACHLMNPAQNYALRDGDELVLPSAQSTPAGLQRPHIARISNGN